jgi:signal transduction histidine kinase
VNGRYQRVAHFEHISGSPFSLPSNDAGGIIEDRDGNLWIGTPHGLAMLDKRREHIAIDKHVEGDSTSLVSDQIISIHEDRLGGIWIGTNHGLSQLIREMPPHQSARLKAEGGQGPGAPHRFRTFLLHQADAHPIGGNFVSDILHDRESHLWIATYGRGLNRLESDGNFTRFSHPGDSLGIKENWIYFLTEGREGVFWLSTRAGLVSFDQRTPEFKRYSIDQLANQPIFGIFLDQRDDLWLSTSIGLARFSPKTRAFVRFDEKHGIPFKELHSGFSLNSRGKLLVGGLDGFTEFDPDSVNTTSQPPEIALTSFSVFDKELSASVLAPGEIHLSHDQNFFSFSFAALDYANPQQNRFAYKMEGVDEEWIDAGTRNYARYTHLDPGSYIFRVKGSNSDNVWNESGASIAITVAPPFWQMWWFRILLAGLFAGTMYGAYRYRVQRLLEVERLRLRIADDLHDDVGSNLSTIAMVSRSVQRAPELTKATRRKLAEIYETAVTTSEGMRDIVWFIKPKNDTLDDLLLRMKDTASSLLVDIEHDFHTPKNESSLRVPIDFKRNFFLAFKEILTNIVKHASATKVHISIEQQNSMLETVIRDDGRGFDEHTVRRGNGLGNLQSRARNVGGACEITSAPGKGTTVRFSGRL